MYKKTTLLICLLIYFFSQAGATYVPVPIASGYNADVVAEGIGLPLASTTVPLDAVGGGANFVFVAEDYQNSSTCALPTAPNYLPSSGLLTSPVAGTPGLTFQMAGYAGMNCLHLSSQNESGTLTFASPVAAGEIFLLANSGSGISLLDIVITFTNSDTQQINGVTLDDWYGGSNVVVKAARVGRSSTTCSVEVGTSPSGPNLYQFMLKVKSANFTKQIASIRFTKTNASGTGFPNIMGVSINTPCPVPADQATSFVLASTTSQINGSFTAAASTPGGYIVVRQASGSAPELPVDGMTYSSGGSLGSATVISYGTSLSFSASGLFAGTAYDLYVYAYNNAGCGGGPVYNTVSPLMATHTTALCGGPANVTIPVGPLETFTSLTAALADLNASGISGPVIIELMPGYDGSLEPSYPVIFPFNPCISVANNLTIRPAAGATGLAISSTGANPTIDFSGAGNITIDGRPGGVGAMGPGNLKIINTNSNGSAIRFRNDAVSNAIVYCDLQGQNTSSTSNSSLSGVVYFGEGINSGNDGNTLSYCDIHATGSGYPTMGISAYGSVSSPVIYNDANAVVNCNIYDIYSEASASSAIKLHQGNNGWSIVGNSIYQTASRTYTSAQTHRAFWITPNSSGSGTMMEGSGFTIVSNYIGGSAPLAAGAPMEMTADAATLNVRYMGMDISVGNGTVSTIAANTLQNITLNTGSTSAGSLCGIYQNAGATTIASNTVGDVNTPGSITLNRTGTSTTLGSVLGIRASNGTNTIAANLVAGIKTISATATIGHSIVGIDVTGGVSNTVTANTVTLLDAAGTGTTGTQSVTGISVTGSTTTMITGNTLYNLTNAHTGTSSAQVRGIHVSSSQTQIMGNEIYDLINATASTGSGASAAVLGISMTSGSGASIAANKIHNLKTTNTTVASKLSGIYVSNSSSVTGNTIYFLLPATNAAGAEAAGIHVNGGQQLIANNMIHLGYDDLGNSISFPTSFRGISRTGTIGASHIYYNSIYVGGVNVDAGATTNSYAYYASGAPASNSDTVMNNIFVNERSNTITGGGKHYTAYLGGTSGVVFNHNIYYANGVDGLMGYSGLDIPSYNPSWLNGDANSLSANPQFVNTLVSGGGGTPDLHISVLPTPVANAGIPVSAVSTDMDGNPRDPGTPDIGAHEGMFTPAVLLEITAATASPALPQCIPTDRTITATVTPGSGPVSSATLNYAYNGIIQPSIPMTGGPTVWTAVLPAAQQYDIVTWSVSATDGGTTVGLAGNSYIDASPVVYAVSDKDTVCSGEDATLTAMSVYTLGSGSLTTPASTAVLAQVSPLLHYYGNARTQYLIRASELLSLGMTAGNINYLALEVVATDGAVMNDVNINMAHTTLSDLSSSYENTGLVQVYSIPSVIPTAGINEYIFNTPFTWDGVSNIIVQFCYRNGNTGDGSDAYTVKYDNTSYVSNRFARSDNSQPGMCTSNTSSGTNSGRPKFVFGAVNPGITWAWLPSGGTSNIEVVTPVNTSNAPVLETYYATGTDVVSGCFTTTSVEVVVKNLPDLPMVTSSTQCGTGIPSATATAVGTGTLLWYDQSAGGNPIQTGGNTFNASVTNTTTFYVAELDGTCEGDRAPLTVSVALPDEVTATSAVSAVCPNALLTLEAVQTGTNQSYSYSWTADPLSGSGITAPVTGSSVTVTPTAPGIYRYFLEAEDATGASICMAYDTIQILVAAPPMVLVDKSVDTVCSGSSVTLTGSVNYAVGAGSATSVTGTGAAAQISPFLHYYGNARTQYIFTATELLTSGLKAGDNITSLSLEVVGTGSNAQMKNVSIHLAHTTLNNLSASFENSNLVSVYSVPVIVPVAGLNTFPFSAPFIWDGTSNLIVQICYRNSNTGDGSGAYTVKYDPTSIVSSRFTRGDNAQTGMCSTDVSSSSGTNSGRPMFLFATSTSLVSWLWSPSGTTTNTDVITSINTTGSLMIETSTLTVTDQLTGCSSTVTVDVPIKPALDLPMVTGSSQCGTAVPTATAIAVGSGNILWYDQPTGGTLLQTGGTTYTSPISSTTTFYVAELDGDCESDRVPVIASVLPPDPVTASPDGIAICPNALLTLDVTQTGTNQTYSYDWNAIPEAGSGITGSVSGASISITPTNPGAYKYVVTATDGACITYDTVIISVDYVPDVIVTPLTGNVDICGNNPVTLSAGTKSVLFSENFNNIPYNMTTENFSVGATPLNAGWFIQSSGYYIGFETITPPTSTDFIMTNSDEAGQGANVDTRLISPVINTSGYSTLEISFSHYFRSRLSSAAHFEVTTNGSVWQTIATWTGSDEGSASLFAQADFDLSGYVNNPNFQFRFRFDAGWDWYWAVDDIALVGTILGLPVSWTATPATGAGLPSGAGTLDPANSLIAIQPTAGNSYTYTAMVSTTVGCPATGDAVLNVTQNAVAGLAPSGANSMNVQVPGTSYQYTDASCNLITSVTTAVGQSLGTVSANVTVEATVQNVGGYPYLQRHYSISASESGMATIVLYATQAEFNEYNLAAGSLPLLPTGGVDNGNLKVSKFPTSSFAPGTGELITPTSVVWDAANSWWAITIQVNSFSYFYIHTGISGPLFVNLRGDLTAVNVGSRNRVDWATLQEKNVARYELERSIDGTSFEYLNTIEARQTASAYTYWDEEPVLGMNYYRLRMYSLNGEVQYSGIAKAYVSSDGRFSVTAFPNPVSGDLTVQTSGTQGSNPTITLTDATGKLIQHIKVTDTKTVLPMGHLAPGVYFVRYADDANTSAIKLNKQ